MIDRRKIRIAIRKPLIDAALVPESYISWEGYSFDPSGKALWIRETLLPVAESYFAEDEEEARYILRLDIFGKSANGTKNIEELATAVGALYDRDTNGIIDGDGLKIIIEDSETLRRQEDGAWSFVPVDIHFRAVNI